MWMTMKTSFLKDGVRGDILLGQSLLELREVQRSECSTMPVVSDDTANNVFSLLSINYKRKCRDWNYEAFVMYLQIF